MKAFEVSKNNADIPRGRVIMAIEGNAYSVELLSKTMVDNGFPSTQCADIGDKDGEIIEYFMIARADKKDFMNTYKANKQEITA
jgi:hypothetical protein